MLIKFIWIIAVLTFSSSLAFGHGKHSEVVGQETDPKAFKVLREKSLNPMTGLPKVLDPNHFKGKDKQAYQIASELPGILVRIPCFCGCEGYGHENLLDCFIGRHGAG